jgi:tetratricopeptide (TPR) repeat protein
VQRPEVAERLAGVIKALGIKRTPIAKPLHVLLVVVPDTIEIALVDKICREESLTSIKVQSVLGKYMIYQGYERGMLREKHNYSIWSLSGAISEIIGGAANDTPVAVERVVSRLRYEISGEVLSLSISLDLSKDDDFNLSLQERWPELEQRARKSLAEAPGDTKALLRLASTLLNGGNAKEAERYARAALATKRDVQNSHNLLGDILRAQGKLIEASDHLEVVARLDPTNRSALQALLLCRIAQGDKRKAAEIKSRLDNLGGIV